MQAHRTTMARLVEKGETEGGSKYNHYKPDQWYGYFRHHGGMVSHVAGMLSVSCHRIDF